MNRINAIEDKAVFILFLVALPRTSLTGLQFTVTALPSTDYKTEVLDSLLPVKIFSLAINLFDI